MATNEIKKMIITDAGRKDLINAQNEGRPANWSILCLGDGSGTVPQLNPAAKKLVNEKWTGDIIAKNVNLTDDKTITLHAVVPSDVGDFWVREIGVKNDRGELVIQAEPLVFEKISVDTSGVISELDLYFDIKLSNTELIEVNVDSSNVYVTQKEFNSLRDLVEQKVNQELERAEQESEKHKNELDEKFEGLKQETEKSKDEIVELFESFKENYINSEEITNSEEGQGKNLNDFKGEDYWGKNFFSSENTTVENSPVEEKSYWFSVFKTGEDRTSQFAVTEDDRVFLRSYDASTGEWGEWKEFADMQTVIELRTRVETLENAPKTMGSEAEPEEKVKNMVWFDLNEKIVKVWDGEQWVKFGAVYL